MGLVAYIGGASASGKSTTASAFSEESGYPLLKLDVAYEAIKKTMGDPAQAKEVMYHVAYSLIEDMLRSDTSIVIEGGWIRPYEAKALKCEFGKKFLPVYCGYPGVCVKEKLHQLRKTPIHPISTKCDAEAITRLEQQVEGSRWYLEECNRLALKFVDFSNQQYGKRYLMEYLFKAFGSIDNEAKMLFSA